MTIKLISFDAADTLIKLALSIGDHYSSYAQKHGVNANPKDINIAFKTVFANTPPLGTDGNKGLSWWRDVIERTFNEIGFSRNNFKDFDQFSEDLYEALSEERTWAIFPDVVSTLEKLKEKNYRMIVFSNFDERLIKILQDLKIASYFERIVCSTQIGYAKPDRKAFHKVSELVKLKPEEIVHIGDGVSNDYLGAIDSGLKAILLDRFNQYSESETIKNEERITNLETLISNLTSI